VKDGGDIKHLVTPAYAHVYKRVCKACNEGWLSYLEAEAKRIVEQIIQEQDITLPWVDSLFLSAWVYKIFALTHLSEGGDRAKYIRKDDLTSLYERLMPEGHSYLSLTKSSEVRVGKLNIHLFQNSFVTSQEEARNTDLSLTQCFVGMLRTWNVMFLFAYVPPNGNWALGLDPKLEGAACLWPTRTQIQVNKTSLPDVAKPESMHFYFFHPEDSQDHATLGD